jgi:hypothetical protein
MDHVSRYVPCNLLLVNAHIDLFSIAIPIELCCMLGGQAIRVATMLIHD